MGKDDVEKEGEEEEEEEEMENLSNERKVGALGLDDSSS